MSAPKRKYFNTRNCRRTNRNYSWRNLSDPRTGHSFTIAYAMHLARSSQSSMHFLVTVTPPRGYDVARLGYDEDRHACVSRGMAATTRLGYDYHQHQTFVSARSASLAMSRLQSLARGPPISLTAILTANRAVCAYMHSSEIHTGSYQGGALDGPTSVINTLMLEPQAQEEEIHTPAYT